METYKMEIISDNVFGGKGRRLYEVTNYDGNAEKLNEEFQKWRESLDFWVNAYLSIRGEKAEIEVVIDPLD